MSFIVRNPNAVAFTLADADLYLVFAASETGVNLEDLFSWEKLYRSATAGALLTAINSGNLIRRNDTNTADIPSANAFDDSIWRWQLTKAEKQSLVGTEGSPSPSNPFVTSDDKRLSVDNLIKVKQNPGLGEFSTITAALASITDAGTNNQYEIEIGPGVYTESLIQIKPYVHLSGTYGTFVEPADPDDDIFVANNAAINVRIKFLQLRGATGTGAAAIRALSGQISVLNVVFGNNYYLCSSESSAGLSFITLSNIAVSSVFNTGFRAIATGGTAAIAIASSSINLTVAPQDVFYASGPGSNLILSSSLVQGAVFLAGTNGVRVNDGAIVKASGIGFGRFARGVFVENIGAAPIIQIDASSFDDCTIDAEVSHASATGFVSRPNKIKCLINDNNAVYIPSENQRIISVAKKGGNFLTIGEALDFITDASETKPYVISVGPGVFVEDTLVLKSYIDIIGVDRNITIIEVDDSSKDVITMAGRCFLANLQLRGATDAGAAAIRFQAVDSLSASAVTSVAFGSNNKFISLVSDGFQTTMLATNCTTVFPTQVVDMCWEVQALAGQRALLLISNHFTNLNNLSYYAKASGANAFLYLLEGAVIGFNTSDRFVSVSDAASLILRSNTVSGFDIGLEAENVGAAPNLQVADTSFMSGTWDVLISHPGTTGYFTGVADNNKVSVDPASPLLMRYSDPTSSQIGSVSLGDDYQGPRHDRLVNFSKLMFASSTMGLTEGGELSHVSGTTINVAAGSGFVVDEVDDYIKELTWASANLVLPPDTIEYLYVDNNGTVSYAPSIDASIYIIFLGRVSVDSTGLLFLEQIQESQVHHSNLVGNYLREAIGPIYSSGSIVSQSLTGTLNLDVSSGLYFYGTHRLTPTGGTNVAFITYLQDGSGGWIKTSGVQSVPTAWDDGSGTPVPLGTDKYAKHALYIVGDDLDEAYLLVYSQIEYDSILSAESGNIPTPPPDVDSSVALIATIIVKDSATTFDQIRDERPIIGFKASGVSASAVHGNLLGLLSDDHPQYLLVDGSRAMTGALNMGANAISNAGLINSVNIQAHASRHQPNGADPIPTAAANTITATAVNAVGTSNNLSRADHVHAITTASAVTLTPDAANATGTAAGLARADHVHNIPTATAVSLTAGGSNSQGVAATFARADHTHAAATAAPSSSLSAITTNADGVASTFSRSDHSHNIITGTPSTITLDAANAEGTSSSIARADHIHNLAAASPVTQTPNQSNTEGTSNSVARADHVHTIATAAAVSQVPDAANADGASTSFSKADHVHNIPTAIAVAVGSANAQGVAATFARADHVHEGVHGIRANANAYNYGNVTLQNGLGVAIADTGSGVLTVSVPASLYHTVFYATYPGTGLDITYTGGNVRINDTFYAVAGDTITLAPSTSGEIYVGVTGTVASTTGGLDAPDNSYPFAGYVTDGTSVTLLTDRRTWIGENIVFGGSTDISNILPDTTRAAGVQNRYARADHTHGITAGPPTTSLSATTTNAEGADTSFARADHTHAILTAAAATQTPDQANGAGASADLARADHVHNIPTATAVGLDATSTSTQGAAATFARADHTHAIATGVVSTQLADQANAAGTSANFARADHIHNIPTAIAVSVGAANATGASTSFARADHVHQGVRAIRENAGANRFNNITLQDGPGVSVTDDGTGVFTFTAATLVLTELSVTYPGTGLSVNYTAGKVRFNGTFTSVTAGSLLLTASTAGDIYVDTDGVVKSGTSPSDAVIIASYTTGVSTVTLLSDRRVWINQNDTWGLVAAITTIQPNDTASAGTQNNAARADHRHAISVAAPSVNLSASTTNAAGVATSFSRSDHSHAITTGAASSQSPDQANAAGASANIARADHVHNIPTASAVGLDASSTNAQGAASSFSRADHTHAISTGIAGDIVTILPDATAAAGVLNSYARADHQHAITCDAPTTSLSATTTNAEGAGTSFARNDHTHAILTGVVSTQTPDQANAAGTSANLARADHIHNIPTAAAVGLNGASTNTQGAAGTFARSDHTHAISAGLVGDIVTIQPDATAAAGTSNNFARADHRHAIDAAAAVALTSDAANAEGVSTSFARADHVHNVATAAPVTSLSATTANTQGAAATFANSAHIHAILTGTVSSQTPDQANATGTSANLARADHIHNIATAAPTTSLSATTSNGQGAASTFARSDHSHAILTGVVSSQTPDQANAAGSSVNLARADHVHNIATAAAASLTTSSTNTQGAASSFARSDHTHAVSLINSRVASTSLITTTSGSYVVMTGMTITPVAGTYLVFARACISATSNNRTIEMAIYSNGVQVADSEVSTFIRTGSGFLTATDIVPVVTDAIVTVNGSQAIDLRWNTSGGTAQAQGYGLTIIKLNN